MSSALLPAATDPFAVPLERVEHELEKLLHDAHEANAPTAQCARMSNLVIFCDSDCDLASIQNHVPAIVASHPARVLFLIRQRETTGRDIRASVTAWCRRSGDGQRVCSEQVTLEASGQHAERLPYCVRRFSIGDLPMNLWWASQEPPVFAGNLLYDLAENAQQIIYDSIGWVQPARAVAATSSWLAKFQRTQAGCYRVASDINWRRLKFWRRLLSQGLNDATAAGAVTSISEVVVEHGPHAVVQAWELVSWLASRLGWRVQGGRVQPDVEITWRIIAQHGPVQVRIRRLPEGTSEVHRVRITASGDGKPLSLDFRLQAGSMEISQEGSDAAPRTLLLQPQPLADLISRQLSDRDYDLVFIESMAVAQQLAQSILE